MIVVPHPLYMRVRDHDHGRVDRAVTSGTHESPEPARPSFGLCRGVGVGCAPTVLGDVPGGCISFLTIDNVFVNYCCRGDRCGPDIRGTCRPDPAPGGSAAERGPPAGWRDRRRSAGVSGPAMSRHLRVLLEAGIVADERPPDDARVRVFRLRPDSMAGIRSLARPGAGALGSAAPVVKRHVEGRRSQ